MSLCSADGNEMDGANCAEKLRIVGIRPSGGVFVALVLLSLGVRDRLGVVGAQGLQSLGLMMMGRV